MEKQFSIETFFTEKNINENVKDIYLISKMFLYIK